MALDSEGNIEAIKYRFSRRLLLLDKGLLALLLAIAVFVLNRGLETYKAQLQSAAETQKAESQKDLERLRGQSQVELEQLRSVQQEQLQSLRNRQDRDIEGLRGSYRFQGALAERRLKAYEDVWNAGSDVGVYLTGLSGPMRGEVKDVFVKKYRHFIDTFAVNQLYLDAKSAESLGKLELGVSIDVPDDGEINLTGKPFLDYIVGLEKALLTVRERMYTELAPGTNRKPGI